MDNLESQVLPMWGFVDMARKATEYTVSERCGFLVFAHMHACQAAIYSNTSNAYGLGLHDYKHAIGRCIEKVMQGTALDHALKSLPEWSDKRNNDQS